MFELMMVVEVVLTAKHNSTMEPVACGGRKQLEREREMLIVMGTRLVSIIVGGKEKGSISWELGIGIRRRYETKRKGQR